MTITRIIVINIMMLLTLSVLSLVVKCRRKKFGISVLFIFATLVIAHIYFNSKISNKSLSIRLDGIVVANNNYINLLSYL